MLELGVYHPSNYLYLELEFFWHVGENDVDHARNKIRVIMHANVLVCKKFTWVHHWPVGLERHSAGMGWIG